MPGLHIELDHGIGLLALILVAALSIPAVRTLRRNGSIRSKRQPRHVDEDGQATEPSMQEFEAAIPTRAIEFLTHTGVALALASLPILPGEPTAWMDVAMWVSSRFQAPPRSASRTADFW